MACSVTVRAVMPRSVCCAFGSPVMVAATSVTIVLMAADPAPLAPTPTVPEPAMAAEAAYLAALGRVREIVRDGEELVARGDGVELRFATLPPPPTADLVGTSWVLDTVLVGDVAASPIGEPALLELNADGTFSGSTGCRSFSGGWTEQGDQIVAPSWGLDEETCPAELSAQDDHIVSVIGDGFIPTIDGDLLTLMDPGGVGLVYRAGE
jgi:heat shock protein HslJ